MAGYFDRGSMVVRALSTPGCSSGPPSTRPTGVSPYTRLGLTARLFETVFLG